MNASKMREPRFWRKWYESGAVNQPKLAGEELEIVGIAVHSSGLHQGYSTLSLGDKIINSGDDWAVSVPVLSIFVPTKNYECGMRLKIIPGNAMPTDVVFSKTRLYQ